MPGFDCECSGLKDYRFSAIYHDIIDKSLFTSDTAFIKRFPETTAWSYWRKVVTQFSKMRLTFAQDKLPALAGIAEQIASLTKSRHLAGLWESDFARVILWCVDQGGPRKNATVIPGVRANPYLAPTWSWASIEFVINQQTGACSKHISYQRATYVDNFD